MKTFQPKMFCIFGKKFLTISERVTFNLRTFLFMLLYIQRVFQKKRIPSFIFGITLVI